MVVRLTITLILVLSLAMNLHAQEDAKNTGRISGLMYVEYFYNIKHVDTLKNVNGFQFRRIYFTYDQKLDQTFDMRFRLEANDVTLTSKNLFSVLVKDAYIRWNEVYQGAKLVFGVSPTPGINLSEEWWGYRSLEKSLLDVNRIASSRDLGVDLLGRFDDQGKYNYWVKVGNGGGSATEFDRYKRIYGQVWASPLENLNLRLYGQYGTRPKSFDPILNDQKNNDSFTVDGMIHYEKKNTFAAGIEGFHRVIANEFQETPTSPLKDEKAYGISAYGWFAFNQKVRVVARYDYTDLNMDLSNASYSYIIGAIDYALLPQLRVMPNVYYRAFKNDTPDFFVARITLHYNY